MPNGISPRNIQGELPVFGGTGVPACAPSSDDSAQLCNQAPGNVRAGYLHLYESGELEHRARSLEARLVACDLCPRSCRVDRTRGEVGFCRAGHLAAVASFCDHHGEEPALSGTRGSGTIFFGYCSLRCVFCQNHQISQPPRGVAFPELRPDELAERMLILQDVKGCHNINLVSPTHYVPQIVRALVYAVSQGLHVPLVYNSSGYDLVGALRELSGIIDIYLPDLKYAADGPARKFSQAPSYVEHARKAIGEMHRQVGNLVLDDEGVAVKGLIVRHLVLPNDLAGSRESLRWLAEEISPDVAVSVMAQYFPSHKAARVPLLSRRITASEYAVAVDAVAEFGMGNGWVQEPGAAEFYVPDFERQAHPFHGDMAAASDPV